MSTEIDQIRARLHIVDIAERYGVKLRRSGLQFLGLCPFHAERTPSFYVHPVKDLFKCHGCGAGGDVFSFIQQIERVAFPRALTIAADMVGVQLDARPWTGEQKQEYAEHQADRELVTHYRMIEGIPERDHRRAAAALAMRSAEDPTYMAWLDEDLEQAKDICALIVGLLAISQERERQQEVSEI
jgi:DNA primase catalytic core